MDDQVNNPTQDEQFSPESPVLATLEGRQELLDSQAYLSVHSCHRLCWLLPRHMAAMQAVVRQSDLHEDAILPAVEVGSGLLKLFVKVPRACAGAPVRVWLVRRIFGWRPGRLGGHIHPT